MSASRPKGEAYQGTPAEMTRLPSQWMVSALRSATACASDQLNASAPLRIFVEVSAQLR